MHFYLIDMNKRIVLEFDAADATLARAQVVQFCRDNLIKVILSQALRIITPTQAIPPPTVDDQPYV